MSAGSDSYVDHYAVLGVSPADDVDTIRKAYKKLALKHHPDKGGDAADFRRIREAVDILTDMHTRAEFDNMRTARERAEERESSRPGPSSSNYRRPGTSSSRSEEQPRQQKKPQEPRRGPGCGHYGCPDHNGDIALTFHETLRLIRSCRRKVHGLKEDLIDLMAAYSPVTYSRRGNRLGEMYDKVGRYLDFTHRWLEIWETQQLGLRSSAHWGFACDDFEILECLKRMGKEIAFWIDHSMQNALEIDRAARFAIGRLSVYDPRAEDIRYNCLVDLEVEMAAWPKHTWNIGFQKYDY